MTYVPKDTELACYAFVDEVTPSGVTVLYASQRTPRPSHPFASLAVIEDTPIQLRNPQELTDVAHPDGDWTANMDTEREVTFSINVFGPDAYETARLIANRVKRRDILALNSANGLAYRRVDSLIRLFEETARDTENRANVTITFGYRNTESYSYPAVERVIATGEDELSDISIDEDLT